MTAAAPTATILVVDDDPGLLRLIGKVLVREGFEPVTAASGREAVNWLAANRADLMLLDLKLPDIEGAELLQQLAAINRPVPFVIITGQGDERVAVEMMKRGALEYLVKDVQFLEFIPTVIRRALEQLAADRRLVEAEDARQQAEESSRQSDERLRWALEGAQGGAWAWNVQTGETWWSAEMYELWGMAPGSLIRLENSLARIHPDDVDHVRQAVARALAGVTRYQCEYRIHHPTRGGRWIAAHGRALPAATGAAVRLVGICLDITDRKQTEEALRRSEQALAAFFAEAPLGLMWVGPDGTVQRVNAAQLEHLRRPEEEVLGHAITEFGLSGELAVLLEQVAATESAIRNFRSHFQARDGSARHVLIDAKPVREGRRLVRSEWFVRDITRRVELEAEILNISEQERRRFGQDLHDDLCQTLTGIGFRLDTLAQQLATGVKTGADEVKQLAEMIRKTTRHARELAHGLAPVHFEADGLSGALQDLARRTAEVFGIDCRFECPRPVPVKNEATGIHLYRIAQEAVGNAVKHGRPRHIAIKLIQTDRQLVLGVRDDGRGLPRSPRKHQGIGLRIMNYRAGVIGGSLAVQRGPTGGTEVVCTVHLPPHVPKPGQHPGPPSSRGHP